MDDEELRLRLGGIDPAASLPALDAEARARLLARTETDDDVEESRSDGVRRRSSLTWVVAAAAVVVLALGALALVRHGSHDTTVAAPGPQAGSPPPQGGSSSTTPDSPDGSPTGSAGGDGTVTMLVATAPTARCMVPSADALGRQSLALEATVTSIADGVATLAPGEVYAGDPGEAVTVAAPSRQLQALVAAVHLTQGGHYLLAATDGRLAVCGLSGLETPQLASLYADAFGG